jgi:hypothetical protein
MAKKKAGSKQKQAADETQALTRRQLEAGFGNTDQFQRLIIDPGVIKTEQQQTGNSILLQVAQRQLETC